MVTLHAHGGAELAGDSVSFVGPMACTDFALCGMWSVAAFCDMATQMVLSLSPYHSRISCSA